MTLPSITEVGSFSIDFQKAVPCWVCVIGSKSQAETLTDMASEKSKSNHPPGTVACCLPEVHWLVSGCVFGRRDQSSERLTFLLAMENKPIDVSVTI